jgi:hypothetical protein
VAFSFSVWLGEQVLLLLSSWPCLYLSASVLALLEPGSFGFLINDFAI